MPGHEPFHFQTRIRFIDTDASGRIHYTAMFRYFESAEMEFMRSLGIRYDHREYAFPRVHVECDFMLSIVSDDLIDIELRLAKLGGSSLRFEFRALKHGDLAAQGAVVIACMGRASQKAVRIPPDVRARLETALDPHQKTVAIGD